MTSTSSAASATPDKEPPSRKAPDMYPNTTTSGVLLYATVTAPWAHIHTDSNGYYPDRPGTYHLTART